MPYRQKDMHDDLNSVKPKIHFGLNYLIHNQACICIHIM